MADIRTRLSEVEQRVRSVVAVNRKLRARIKELESELDRAARDLEPLRASHAKRELVRERLERILVQLESLQNDDGPKQKDAQE